MRRQFEKLTIQLVIRATDWNRFQDKIRKGNTQIFRLGWNADYPDPENFLFLLHGPQSRAKSQGENAANYANPEFDRLFEQMKNMPNSPERQKIIDRMVDIARVDAPWIWGVHPEEIQPAPLLDRERQAEQHGAQQHEVPRIDPQRRARAARRVEPAGAVAARPGPRGSGGLQLAGRGELPAPRAHGRAAGRENRGARCWPTSSAGSCTRSRS